MPSGEDSVLRRRGRGGRGAGARAPWWRSAGSSLVESVMGVTVSPYRLRDIDLRACVVRESGAPHLHATRRKSDTHVRADPHS